MDAWTPTHVRTRLGTVALFALVVAVAACTHADGLAGGAPSSYGAVSGRVARGPIFAASRPDSSTVPDKPVSGAELRFVDARGGLAATARTDREGRYRVNLPPGNYRTERGAGFTGAARNLPAMVVVSPGGETRLDIWVDTGIR